jgi:hypothetical protein
MDVDGILACLLFAAKTGACAGAFVFLDFCIVQAGRDSYLQITHGYRVTPTKIVIWALGAAIVAGLGTLLGFYQKTLQSIVFIALTWPAFWGCAMMASRPRLCWMARWTDSTSWPMSNRSLLQL